MALVGIPTWILLLFLFPFSGLGPLLCLTGATLVTAAVVVWSERRRGPIPGDDDAPASDEPRAPMGALAGAGIAMGVVVLLVYVLFVIRAA
jgi:uncharacterized iron-regulated membrane protein